MNTRLSYTPDFSDRGTFTIPVPLHQLGVRRTTIVSETTSGHFRYILTHPASKTVFLVNLISPRYRLNTPLGLELEKTENGVVVSDSKSGAYGAGTNEREALKDFQSMFVEMFEQLSEQERNLSKALADKLDYLRSVISPK